ncbi:MAG: hypothetical protein IJX47_00950 [Clostridia bacterium]|nr:hypothetical protein [Clostridia bacterium]MBQ8381753.1 hypothetical protein [Clostridia bacterium]
MSIQALLMTLEICLVFAFLRCIYRWIRYFFRLCALRKTFKKLTRAGITVTYKRKLRQIVFGKKGGVDIVLTVGEKKYGIALLTHRLGMGRWNIERTRSHYYFEVRKSSVLFNLQRSSENLPDHVKDFGKEKQVSRKLLDLSASAEEYDRLYLLVYPKPKYLTYTETRYQYLYEGDPLEDYEILFANGLQRLLACPGD